jgi:hypothetical protein
VPGSINEEEEEEEEEPLFISVLSEDEPWLGQSIKAWEFTFLWTPSFNLIPFLNDGEFFRLTVHIILLFFLCWVINKIQDSAWVRYTHASRFPGVFGIWLAV